MIAETKLSNRITYAALAVVVWISAILIFLPHAVISKLLVRRSFPC